MKNSRLLLTLKYTAFMSVVLVAALIIIYMVTDRARHEAFSATLRSEAVTKANLFLENRVDAATMQHIYLNNMQFINEVEIAVYTPDFKMLYHDAANHDVVKESPSMIDSICRLGEMNIDVAKGYQAIGILYQGRYVVTAAAHDGYGECNMASLRNTLLVIFVVSIALMALVGYLLASLTIRPIERALNSQKMFASHVSHELRTPLAAIMGELDLDLQRERSPLDYQERIDRALTDASRMCDTIIGLLNMARAEYDASQIKMEEVRIDELIMDVVEELIRVNPEYRIDISFALMDGTPLSQQTSVADGNDIGISVAANRYLLALAVRNLIENNCKYSPDHACKIVIHNTGRLRVSFSDKGVGMTVEEQRNLFRPFFRGSATDIPGHGIGMALVQWIVSLHHFRIGVRSKEGFGTTFTLFFH